MLTTKPAMAPFRLTVCGIAELECHSTVGVTHLLSILDPAAPDPEAIRAFPPHRRALLRFDDIVEDRPDRFPPREEHIAALLAFGEDLSAAAELEPHLLVHCHMGISRSTAAMAILLAQPNPGREAEAFSTLLRIRPRAWPNSRMVAIADRMLDRRGALTDALTGYQRAVLDLHPEVGDLITSVGRGAEVERAVRAAG
jgi:predicted protein tyrosine phosphatase